MNIDEKPVSEKLSFEVVNLDKTYLEKIIKLQKLVIDSLEDKVLCVSLSEEEYLDALGDKGIVVGVKKGDNLVGIYVGLFPGQSMDNLGREINLDKNELEKVCHLELAFIDPKYRGMKLHYKLGVNLISEVQTYNMTRYFFATVEPRNLPSLKNLFSFGLYIVKFNEMYGGLKRFVLCHDIGRLIRWDKSNAIIVSSNEIDYQRELLQQGWQGMEMKREFNETFIVYCKEKL
ncbi:hypothetical protein [Natranaerofaba carboxydovora]|uniref:hypothetical protein n=1 Tax=Natranaerofaba carboxydovora TaxID=2742683 RepID=UPI001F14910F|nr:hypothetical protein [Natranaerofaba carboxydovora]UMZ72803.1 hypothetical protein ACONDI_00332 [Natranaerofaba carboxydovora]